MQTFSCTPVFHNRLTEIFRFLSHKNTRVWLTCVKMQNDIVRGLTSASFIKVSGSVKVSISIGSRLVLGAFWITRKVFRPMYKHNKGFLKGSLNILYFLGRFVNGKTFYLLFPTCVNPTSKTPDDPDMHIESPWNLPALLFYFQTHVWVIRRSRALCPAASLLSLLNAGNNSSLSLSAEALQRDGKL